MSSLPAQAFSSGPPTENLADVVEARQAIHLLAQEHVARLTIGLGPEQIEALEGGAALVLDAAGRDLQAALIDDASSAARA